MAQVSSKKCQMCFEEDAKFYCYECQYVLCDLCKQRHNQIPMVAGHMVCDLSTIDIAVMNNSLQCLDHEKEFFCFCLKCNILICGKCVLSSHNGHSFAEIDETVSKERTKAEEKLSQLQSNIEDSEKLISTVRNDHIEFLKADSKKLKDETNEFYDNFGSFLEQKRNLKINNTEDQEVNEESNFNQFIGSIEKMVEDFRLHHSKLSNLLQEKHNVTFYRSFQDLCTEIDSLDEVPVAPETIDVPEFDARECYKEIVDHIHSKLSGKCCRSCTKEHTQIVQTLEEDVEGYKASSQKFEKLYKEISKELLVAEERCNKYMKYKKKLDDYEELNSKNYVDSIHWTSSTIVYFCSGCLRSFRGKSEFDHHIQYSFSRACIRN